MIKQVNFGKESRDKLVSGVKKITAAIKCTMGGAGKNVLIGKNLSWFSRCELYL